MMFSRSSKMICLAMSAIVEFTDGFVGEFTDGFTEEFTGHDGFT